LELSGAPLPVGAPRHETQQPPHRYATGLSILHTVTIMSSVEESVTLRTKQRNLHETCDNGQTESRSPAAQPEPEGLQFAMLNVDWQWGNTCQRLPLTVVYHKDSYEQCVQNIQNIITLVGYIDCWSWSVSVINTGTSRNLHLIG